MSISLPPGAEAALQGAERLQTAGLQLSATPDNDVARVNFGIRTLLRPWSRPVVPSDERGAKRTESPDNLPESRWPGRLVAWALAKLVRVVDRRRETQTTVEPQ